MGTNDSEADKAGEKRKELMRRIVIGAGAVVAFGGVWLMWQNAEPPVAVPLTSLAGVDSHNARGDSFGAINALFSGLAFAGVIVAILLQREELRLQRKELQETRNVFERQAKAQEDQEKALEKQRRAQLLGAAITAQTAFLHDVLERVKTNYFGFRDPHQASTDHAKANANVGALVRIALSELGLDGECKPF